MLNNIKVNIKNFSCKDLDPYQILWLYNYYIGLTLPNNFDYKRIIKYINVEIKKNINYKVFKYSIRYLKLNPFDFSILNNMLIDGLELIFYSDFFQKSELKLISRL